MGQESSNRIERKGCVLLKAGEYELIGVFNLMSFT
jgi:hypothetical protein